MNARLLSFPQRPQEAHEASDEELLAACARQEQAALALLFDRHQRRVQRFLGHSYELGEADMEDILQLTFLEAYHKAGSFQGRSSVPSWLLGIALNKARHHLRSRSRRSSLLQALKERWSPPPPAPPDLLLAGQQQEEALRRALAALPEHLRVVFVACELEGLSGVEATRALELREGTLYRRLHQARGRLMEALKEER